MKFAGALGLVVVAMLATTAQAGLLTIGTADYDSDGNGQSESYALILDTNESVIWLDYVRDGDTWEPGASTQGGSTWSTQMEWASSLGAQGALSYSFNVGVSVTWAGDWRLPSAGASPTGGWAYGTEFGSLYYVGLGNPAGGYGDKSLFNFGPFANLLPSAYWLETEFVPAPLSGQGTGAWAFNFANGGQGAGGYDNDYRAMALREASVSISVVPSPPPHGWASGCSAASAGLIGRLRKRRSA